jgi:hypothetical protein
MLDLHLTKDSGSVVRHGNFTIGGDENFVQPYMVHLSFSLGISSEMEEPLGPNDVRMMLATVLAASICCCGFIGSREPPTEKRDIYGP